jgi:hypothetical protein
MTFNAVPRMAACGPDGAVVGLAALVVGVGAVVGEGAEHAATATTAAARNPIARGAPAIVIAGY